MSNYKHIINKLAMKYNIPSRDMEILVNSQFEFIKEVIEGLDFHSIESEEEFNELKSIFSVKHLFKIVPNYGVLKHVNKNKNEISSKGV